MTQRSIDIRLTPDATARLADVVPDSAFGPCAVSFRDNKFIVLGEAQRGNSAFSVCFPNDRVTVLLSGYTYPGPSDRRATLLIAVVAVRRGNVRST